ncbi:MAG: TetR/AcrR family transcriptional regulator [Acholeplasmataceae bacterium]
MPHPTFFNLPKEKQDFIMNAVLDELSIHDYEAFNISNIIRATGIARGSFYQYFKDKDDLYAYFYTYIGQLKYQYYGNLFDPTHDIPLIERLNLIFEKGLLFRKDYPKLVDVARLMLHSSFIRNDPNYHKNLSLALDLYESFVKRDIELGIIRNDLDSRTLAELIMVVFNHLTQDKLINQTLDDLSIKMMLNHILNIIEKGVTPHV